MTPDYSQTVSWQQCGIQVDTGHWTPSQYTIVSETDTFSKTGCSWKTIVSETDQLSVKLTTLSLEIVKAFKHIRSSYNHHFFGLKTIKPTIQEISERPNMQDIRYCLVQ